VRQIFPSGTDLTDQALAALYSYPQNPGTLWLRANMVTSLDGAATVKGRSGGLSGEADRQVFAMLRALADVIVVGAGTVRAEGYEPIRPGVEGVRWQWLREGRTASAPIAVITRGLDLDLAGPLLTAAPRHARTIIYTTGLASPARRAAAAATTADVVACGETDVDLTAVLADLAGRGHRRVLTEGGPHLLSQLAAMGLLDELCLTLSPLLTGPDAGRIVQPAAAALAAPARTPFPLRLAHVVEDDAYLLCRYVRAAPAGAPAELRPGD
jgi:riboflavin biosynthesis pyrimidine reductase